METTGEAQCDAYVVNPFGNSNGLYMQNLFDYKPTKYHLVSKNSKKPENPENVESGSKIRIRKFRENFSKIFSFLIVNNFCYMNFLQKWFFLQKVLNKTMVFGVFHIHYIRLQGWDICQKISYLMGKHILHS